MPAIPSPVGSPPTSQPASDSLARAIPPRTRPPIRFEWLLALTTVQRQGLAARCSTRHVVPTEGERWELVRWEQRAVSVMAPMLQSVEWPGVDVVGETGAEAAWWIALVCDRHTAFQMDARDALAAAVEEHRAPARHLAYLEDRLRMHEGAGPQLYGTQHRLFADGSVELYPVAQPDLLVQRRQHVGLPAAGYRQADLRLLSLTRGPHISSPARRPSR